MVAPSQAGIKVPKWKLRRSTNREGRQNADYNNLARSGKERDPVACSQSAWQGGLEEVIEAQPGIAILREFSAVPDRHGFVQQCSLLGKETADNGPYGPIDGPQFVKPYVKTNKNDAADAEAICEAVARPNMRFAQVKEIEQQAVLSLHRARQGFVKARTAQANQIRGLLDEYGIILPQGMTHLTQGLSPALDEAIDNLPAVFRQLVQCLLEHLKELDRQVSELELQIQLWRRESATSQKLAQIPGIGAITASAMVASIGDARCFENGRQLAAWLGLVPR